MRKELYTTYGSRSEYLAAPLWEILEERCRINAWYLEEAERQKEQEEEMEAERRRIEVERARMG